MKKVYLSLLLTLSCNMLFAQYGIFMQILENKKICNKEDELTYFLQANSYERQNENHYYHYYAVGGMQYYTLIINDNECYVTYRTDNAKDYNKIKAEITATCPKELAADKSESYVCNTKRVRDVQIMFPGYSQKDKYYEILVYQDPNQHETPYYQENRILPGADKMIVKKAKKHIRKAAKPVATTEAAKTAATTPAATTAAKTPTPKAAAPSAVKPATMPPPVAPAPKVTMPVPGKIPPVKTGTPAAPPSVIKK